MGAGNHNVTLYKVEALQPSSLFFVKRNVLLSDFVIITIMLVEGTVNALTGISRNLAMKESILKIVSMSLRLPRFLIYGK